MNNKLEIAVGYTFAAIGVLVSIAGIIGCVTRFMLPYL